MILLYSVHLIIFIAIFSSIIEFYASGKPIVTDEKPRTDTEIKEGDSEVVQAIKVRNKDNRLKMIN